MKSLTLIGAVITILLASCSKKDTQEEYDLNIGDEVIKLAITPQDIRGMEDEAVQKIMVLWDHLEEGKSAWFSYSITRPWADPPDLPVHIQEKYNITYTQTIGSGKWRFFKIPNGEYGIENESNPIVRSTNASREDIAQIVRSNLDKFKPIL